MVASALLLAVGLGAPLLLGGRAAVGGSPRLIIAGNIAALAVAWTGLLALVAAIGGTANGAVGHLVELCQLLASPGVTGSAASSVAAVLVLVLVPGRALWQLGRSCAGQVRLRRTLRLGGPRRAVVHARMDTVACTVGVLSPRVVVDAERFDHLPAEHQRTVLAHERQHARGRHLFIDVVARCLAAGLAPWPGARIAAAEVRRQLEAAADDAAAKQVGRRAVATAIVDVACGPAPGVGALGAAGWAAWRVARLLSAPGRSLWATSVSLAVVALAIHVTLHLVAHPFHSLADLPADVWSAVCCVV